MEDKSNKQSALGKKPSEDSTRGNGKATVTEEEQSQQKTPGIKRSKETHIDGSSSAKKLKGPTDDRVTSVLQYLDTEASVGGPREQMEASSSDDNPSSDDDIVTDVTGFLDLQAKAGTTKKRKKR